METTTFPHLHDEVMEVFLARIGAQLLLLALNSSNFN